MDALCGALHAAGYSGACEPKEALLYPGPTRFDVLEFLIGCFVGSEATSVFKLAEAQLHGEEAHVQSLTNALNMLGIPVSTEAVMGSGSCEERIEFLNHLLTLASKSSAVSGRRREEVTASTATVSVAAGAQNAMLMEQLDLFPADLQKALETYSCEEASEEELEERTSHAREATAQLRRNLACSESETKFMEQQDRGKGLELDLRNFREAAAAFTQLYTEDLSVWANSLPSPELHGIGPSSSAVLQKYMVLKQVLDGARGMRDAFTCIDTELCPEFQSWLPSFVQRCRDRVSQLKHDSEILQSSQQRALG